MLNWVLFAVPLFCLFFAKEKVSTYFSFKKEKVGKRKPNYGLVLHSHPTCHPERKPNPRRSEPAKTPRASRLRGGISNGLPVTLPK